MRTWTGLLLCALLAASCVNAPQETTTVVETNDKVQS